MLLWAHTFPIMDVHFFILWTYTSHFASAFQPASLEEVTTLGENGKTKSSKIDPMPIAILTANTSILRVFQCSGTPKARCHHASSETFFTLTTKRAKDLSRTFRTHPRYLKATSLRNCVCVCNTMALETVTQR